MKTAQNTVSNDLKKYAPIVWKIANKIIGKFPSNVEKDDLIQVGMIGLMHVIKQFDPKQGFQFDTFATKRIQGAMIDDLRKRDHMHREDRRKLKALERTINQLKQLKDRPEEKDVAEKMGLSLGDYQKLRGQVKGIIFVDVTDLVKAEDSPFFNALYFGGSHPDPSEILEEKRRRQRVVDAMVTLPEPLKRVMEMYYEQDLNLKDIGSILHVTESRVCRMHLEAIQWLRNHIESEGTGSYFPVIIDDYHDIIKHEFVMQ